MVRESPGGASTDVPADSEPPPDRRAWALRPVAQVLGMYIVAEDGDSVYLIDQHAAHERVLFERFSKRLVEREIHQVPLLTPLTLRLSPTEFEAFNRHRDELSGLGMTFDEFGGMDVVLRAVPDIWEGLDIQALAEDLIRSLPQLTKTADPRERLREWVVTKACKAAVKANHRLSDMEMEALCEALMDLDDPFHCPHGRPVFIRLTRAELDRHFRRTV
jgi:DNA mismatch repair protein MutL